MKYYDLSYPLNATAPLYPGDPPFSCKQDKTLERDGYLSYVVQTGMHTGTHMDYPSHMLHGGSGGTDIPLDRFTGKGIVLDVRGQEKIYLKREYPEKIRATDIVLLYTGYDAYYREEKYFTSHPVVSKEFMDMLIAQNVKILGMDMPSPDYEPYPVHVRLLAAGVLLLENLRGLRQLLNIEEFEVFAFPVATPTEAGLVRAVARVR